jgi:hypothetical protein
MILMVGDFVSFGSGRNIVTTHLALFLVGVFSREMFTETG